MQKNWLETDYARFFLRSEYDFQAAALKQAIGPSTLQIGGIIDQRVIDELDLPLIFKTMDQPASNTDILADAAFLPFSPESFSTVVLPHVLEQHNLPHQVLREAHRILMYEGHIVLTGFNPYSFLGLQRKLRPSAVCAGRYYSPRRVTDWLQLLGFEIVGSVMFQYAPLSRRERVQKSLKFLESMGDRWLPMFGGGYMINAKKKEAGMTFVGKPSFVKKNKKRSKLAASPARNALRSKPF